MKKMHVFRLSPTLKVSNYHNDMCTFLIISGSSICSTIVRYRSVCLLWFSGALAPVDKANNLSNIRIKAKIWNNSAQTKSMLLAVIRLERSGYAILKGLYFISIPVFLHIRSKSEMSSCAEFRGVAISAVQIPYLCNEQGKSEWQAHSLFVHLPL